MLSERDFNSVFSKLSLSDRVTDVFFKFTGYVFLKYTEKKEFLILIKTAGHC